MNAVGENYKKMAPEEGFEPPTKWLTATCSTVELFRNTSRGQNWIVLIFVNRIMLFFGVKRKLIKIIVLAREIMITIKFCRYVCN